MILLALAILWFLCAAIPCTLFCLNLRLYVPPPQASGPLPAVSILIPARNEAAGITAALAAALATRDVEFEIVVMDDSSIDGTPEIVLGHADPRVRLERAPALPEGWNGKQHACWALANAARNPVLCFVDADVRLAPNCISRMTAFLESSDAALVSGFPQQITGTFLEWMLLPLIHFVLLGFLPVARMRAGTDPNFAAGCGQFLMARRKEYFACGGHSGIQQTMHDGLRLPRLFRAAGYRTDLADITALATCRMYTNARDTWNGLAKNAVEGIAAPARIVPITLILLLGQVVPFLGLVLVASLLLWLVSSAGALGMEVKVSNRPLFSLWICVLLGSLFAAWLPRWLAASRFRQDRRSAFFHPFGILLLLAVQWYALIRKLRGSPITWRTRAYSEPSS